jgi:SAM-dependent methyltransferase
MGADFEFACPSCRRPLAIDSPDSQSCAHDGLTFRKVDGVWRFLLADRAAALARFMDEYEGIRRAEGRGSSDPGFYRRLPETDPSYHRAKEWHEMAKSCRALMSHVILPSEGARPLHILDLGAGNGWLANRLAARGHHLAAIDLSVSPYDGLGACARYDVQLTPIQAEFDRLPLTDRQIDLVLFNAAFHYSENVLKSAGEAFRTIRTGGQLVVIDTPIYRDGGSGAQMVMERQERFRQLCGYPSDGLQSEQFLTLERVASLSEHLGGAVKSYWPVSRWRRTLRQWRVSLRGRREPAQFPLLVWQKVDKESG